MQESTSNHSHKHVLEEIVHRGYTHLMRFLLTISATLSASLLLAACSSSVPKAQFYHAEHGVVSRQDARLSAVLEACGRQSYAQGITIDGTVVTDRKIATAAWSRYVIGSVAGARAGSSAGTQDALTADADASAQATQDPAKITGKSPKPAFYGRFRELEQQTWDCVAEHGWTRRT